MIKQLQHLIFCFCLIWASLPVASSGEISEKLKGLGSEQVDILKKGLSREINEYVSDPNNFAKLDLSSNDKEALRILGYSDSEIELLKLDSDELGKLKDRAGNYMNKKSGEIEKGTMNDLIPGLTSSVIGLTFASMLGIVIGVRCRNMPSALSFAGTSTAWVGLEMSIWKGYRIEMDDIKTLQNAAKIPDRIQGDIKKVKKLVKSLTSQFKASGLEEFDEFLKTKEAEVEEVKQIAMELRDYLRTIKDKQFGALRSLQKSLELAAETSEKKAKNAKIAAIGYTASAGVAAAEAFNVFGGGGMCLGAQKPTTMLERAIDLILPMAIAGFANLGDLDKIGIPVGAGLAAAYLAFEKKFADKIYANGASRAVIFGSMAGLAYLASAKLKESAEFLRKQAHEMDVFATVVEDAIKGKQIDMSSASEIVDSIKKDLLPKVDTLVETMKDELPNSADINEKIDEVKDKLANSEDSLKKAGEKFEDAVKNELDLKSEEISSLIEEAKTKLDVKLTSKDFGALGATTSYMSFFLPEAHASVPSLLSMPRSCFRKSSVLLTMDESCSCYKDKSCARSYFPQNLEIKSSHQFAGEVVKTALLVNKANNLILNRKADEGSVIYSEIGKNISKVEAATEQVLAQKMKTSYGDKQINSIVVAALQTTKEALPNLLAKQSQALVPSTGDDKFSRSMVFKMKLLQKENVRAKLRDHLQLAKYVQSQSASALAGENNLDYKSRSYNYGKNTIIEDKNKSIFEAIKLRYLKIYTSDRLLIESSP